MYGDPSKQSENGGFGAKSPLKGKFSEYYSSINVQYSTPIDVFFPNFMPICPVTKQISLLYPLQNTHFSPPFCFFGSGSKILTRDI